MSYSYVNLFWTDKCGYANCAICKDAIPNSEYWSHIRSHPGHENDGPTPPRTAFENSQQNESKRNRYYGGSKSFNRWSTDATQLEVGKEYQVDITQIGDRGDGIARIQGSLIFVKGGYIGGRVKIMITETRSRYAIARTIK